MKSAWSLYNWIVYFNVVYVHSTFLFISKDELENEENEEPEFSSDDSLLHTGKIYVYVIN